MRISDWSSDVCSSDLNVSQSTISRLGNKLIPAKAQPPLDSDTERAARVFMSRISGRYAVDRAILFGSRASRPHHATSDARSEERRVGKECVSTCRSRL